MSTSLPALVRPREVALAGDKNHASGSWVEQGLYASSMRQKSTDHRLLQAGEGEGALRLG
jgi:hypothetical protein